MIEQILTQNGLTDKEAKVYLAVLAAGEATVAAISSKSHVERTTVYTMLEKMQQEGLISLTKRRGIQYVSALSPRILVDRFKKSAQLAEQVLPDMLELAFSSPLKPRVQFYDGMQGLQEILREFSYSNEDTMLFTDYAAMPKELHQFIWKEIVPERKKRSSFSRLIVPDNAVNAEVQKKDELRYAEHRLVRFPEKENPLELMLFEESKVGFLSFVPGELFGIIIDSKAIYRMQRNLFLLVWEQVKELKKG